jgi:hypothetical protein
MLKFIRHSYIVGFSKAIARLHVYLPQAPARDLVYLPGWVFSAFYYMWSCAGAFQEDPWLLNARGRPEMSKL